MSSEKKTGAAHALKRYYEKKHNEWLKETGQKERRKCKKPEKLVQNDCLEWMRNKGWQVEIYEAKATFDPRIGKYRQQSMKAGTCDCMGITPDGHSVAIEFKAKDRRNTFNKPSNFRQREFILGRINFGAFAVVVENSNQLETFYNNWISILEEKGQAHAKNYLLDQLPKTRTRKNITDTDALFDDE